MKYRRQLYVMTIDDAESRRKLAYRPGRPTLLPLASRFRIFYTRRAAIICVGEKFHRRSMPRHGAVI